MTLEIRFDSQMCCDFEVEANEGDVIEFVGEADRDGDIDWSKATATCYGRALELNDDLRRLIDEERGHDPEAVTDFYNWGSSARSYAECV